MSVRDDLKKVVGAKASIAGQYIKAWGKYRLRLDEMIVTTGRKSTGGQTTYFIARHTVLDMQPITDLAKLGPMNQPNAKGSSANLVIDVNTDYGPGLIMAYLCTLTGDAEGDFDLSVLNTVCGEPGELGDQPLKGLEIIDEAIEKPQKKDKSKSVTIHTWSHLPQTEANKKHMSSLKT